MYLLLALTLALLAWLVLVLLFTPRIDYRLERPLSLDDPQFLHTIQATCQAALHDANRVEVFNSAAGFYPAMIEAIKGASRSINLECYICAPGAVADQFVDALSERARAGVGVSIVLDSVGSSTFAGPPVGRLKAAGCRVLFYQPLRWHSIARLNNRTHRELLVVDGRVGFVGGAGVGDWWLSSSDGRGAWRDTMARFEGPVVASIQGVFAENWLECCGEILTGEAYFPPLEPAGHTTAFLVKSSPADRATVSRVVFQMLVEGARRQVAITTPYFLPDASFRRALLRTRDRGVEITVLVAGPQTDQRWVRLASRRLYGELLERGVRIFEYVPAMMHAKVLVIDEDWAVIGTTNIDNRSFEHNDEVNVAMCDPEIAARLGQDFQQDQTASQQITLDAWRGRPLWERALARIVWILERQQ